MEHINHYYSKHEMDDLAISHEIVSRWEGLGFLAGSLNKRNVALGLELTAYALLTSDTHDSRLNTLLFPVVVRVLRTIKSNISVDEIERIVYELFDEFPLNEIDKVIIEKPEIKTFIDLEAAMVTHFSDSYVRDMKIK